MENFKKCSKRLVIYSSKIGMCQFLMNYKKNLNYVSYTNVVISNYKHEITYPVLYKFLAFLRVCYKFNYEIFVSVINFKDSKKSTKKISIKI